MRAGIYTRLSSDPDGTSTATERQRQDCQKLADARGFEVVDVYEDNDTSAYKKGVKRPAFERMLTDLASRDIDAVIVWRSDRLARQPRDLERVIDAAEANPGYEIVSVTESSFAGPSGLMMLRMLVNFGNHESTVKSERVSRKMRELAENGEPRTGGQRTFGYTRDFEPHPTEAPLFVDAVQRVLGATAYNVIVSEWNDAGITTPTGCKWRLGNWRRMLTAPVFAGLRSYHDELLPGNWVGLITPDVREQLVAVIESRHQPQNRSTAQHLLTGLVVCSCDGRLSGVTRRGVVEYRCTTEGGGCGRTSIRASILEPRVVEVFFDHVDALTDDPGGNITAELLAQRADEARAEQLAKDHYVNGIIDRQTFVRTLRALESRMDARRAVIARAGPLDALRATDVRAEWERHNLTWQRSMLGSAFMGVTVAPAGRNRYADRVTIISVAT